MSGAGADGGGPGHPAGTAGRPDGPRGGRLWAASALAGLAAFVACFLALRARLLPGADSYYHLAIARAMAAHGILRDLPWARFSLMHQGFGDKELLFHLLIAPCASLAGTQDPRLAGALAMGLCVALVAGVLAYLGARAVGWWGLALPFLLVYASPATAERLGRLRPELLSLALLLLACWAMARRRYRLAGGICGLYALSYTAFHALLGLAGLCFLFFGWARRRWEWALPLYAALGTGLGLAVHPNFPHNLDVWVVQNVQLFRLGGALDMAAELFPASSRDVLLGSLAWFLAMAALWCSPRRDGGAQTVHAGTDSGGGQDAPGQGAPGAGSVAAAADIFAIATVVFAVLYLLMLRFATYFYPLATLWTLFELRRRGRAPGRWLVVAGGRRLPLAAVLAVCLAAGWLPALGLAYNLAAETDPGPGAVRLAQRVALSRALPSGARVAAPWWATPIYMFWAPQAAYLNVLDPVFMAVPYPRVYAAQRAVFAGDEPDVPLVATRLLDSDIIAFPETASAARLLARLSGDPRAVALRRGSDAAFRLHRDGRAFVLDWQAPAGGAAYPRLATGAGGEVEGYVDARRLAPQGACIELAHDQTAAAAFQTLYELAPSGPSRLALDGRLIAATAASLHAVLGRGLLVPVALSPGAHRISVTTCPDAESPARTGFYLLQRDPRQGRWYTGSL
jgi:hypothetical protein